MTNKEAIEWIKDMREQNWYIYNCERYHIEALSLAIEALERQVPKKPIKDGIDYAGNPIFCCPICGDNWNSNEFADGMECCWTCGQALDWSEESEERGE